MNFKNNSFKDSLKQLSLNSASLDPKAYISSENMLLTKEGFQTRPALCPIDNLPLFDPSEFSGSTEFIMTSCFSHIEGETAQIAVVRESDEYSYVNYHLFAIFSTNSKKNLGFISFNRTSSDSFSTPLSFVVYSGNATIGGGIYFLAYLSGGYEDYISIYEVNSSLDSWTALSSSRYYIPTILKNGQGDSLNMAVKQDSLRLSVPKSLEPLNMLTDSYISYYTTDGYSSSFTLSENTGEPNAVSCCFRNDEGKLFEWKLTKAHGFTQTKELNGAYVTAEFSPENFKLFFTSDGSAHPLSYIGQENNLKISVSGAMNEDFLKLFAVSYACSVGGNSQTGGAFVTVFSNNLKLPSEVCFINPNAPLYFPKSCRATLPTLPKAQSLLMPLNDRVYIFNGGYVFSAAVSAAEEYKINDIVNGLSDSSAISLPSLSFNRRYTLPSRIIPKTVCTLGENFWFCTEDRSIHRLSSTLKLTSFNSSLPFNPEGAAFYNQNYLLFREKRCLVFDTLLEDSFGLFSWSLPCRLVSSAYFSGKTVFFDIDYVGAINAFEFKGEEDCFFDYSEGHRRLVNRKIPSMLRISLQKSDERCRLYSVSTDTRLSEDALLELFDSDLKIGHHRISSGKSVIKRPAFYNELKLKFSLNGSSKIEATAVKYRKLKKF